MLLHATERIIDWAQVHLEKIPDHEDEKRADNQEYQAAHDLRQHRKLRLSNPAKCFSLMIKCFGNRTGEFAGL